MHTAYFYTEALSILCTLCMCVVCVCVMKIIRHVCGGNQRQMWDKQMQEEMCSDKIYKGEINCVFI